MPRHGLPLSASAHAANHHEVMLVQLSFDFYMIEAKPQSLFADHAYDSDALDHKLKKDGVELIAPHRSNRTMLRETFVSVARADHPGFHPASRSKNSWPRITR